ncbi:hypothetical protein JKP88DRAFT_183439 [Tribonema minus]|uniref:DUF4281 domain-containing protein n=1 Tax=Tribonema minus TaxID=303371 RepID=A0A835YLE3_9STRA|nr:hypothetical protein JKP88DRAFT_183439 [Tribonema minus]
MPIPGLQYSDEQLFGACQLVMPAWALLILAPRFKASQAVAGVTIGFYAIFYTLLMAHATTSGGGMKLEDFNSLAGVRGLLVHPDITLAAWVHYLAFDLFTALMVTRYNLSRGEATVPLVLMAPVLFFTCMAGPVGLCAFAVLHALFNAARGQQQQRSAPAAAAAPKKST